VAQTDDNGLVELVKTYARQETLGPLKGAGRWLAYGTAGAFLLGLGLVLILLGGLRFVQSKYDTTFDGAWSWAPYLFVLIAAGIVMFIAFSRVKKTTLAKEPS
jgi:hypothetical protein